MNLLSARDRLCLEQDCSAGAKGNRKEGIQNIPRLDRLGSVIDDAYTVRSLSHSVDPSAWSYIVRGPSCQLALNIKSFKDVTSLINSSVT